MTDQQPKPRGRRWKRWAALTLVLVVGWGVWVVSAESPTVRRARAFRIGMTEDEVRAVMGEPTNSIDLRVPAKFHSHVTNRVVYFSTRMEYWFLNAKLTVRTRLNRFGPGPLNEFDDWPAIAVFENGRLKSLHLAGKTHLYKSR
jgi:hypothetical protein